MKKIVAIIVILLMTSCGYALMDNSKPVIITKIVKYDNIYCNYYGEGNINMVTTQTSSSFKFRDICGKYQIGDTIRFMK